MRAVTPSVASRVWMKQPSAQPSPKPMPARRPRDRPRLSTERLSGPGASVMSAAARRKPAIWARVKSGMVAFLMGAYSSTRSMPPALARAT